jgi:citron Rho-interacting kinase
LGVRNQALGDCLENATEYKNQLEMFKKNYDMLKEASAITESQLEELAEMWYGEVQRNKTNGEKIDEM